MNRVLFKAAAIVNIAAAALIYVACSGDDGKDGQPGAGCVGTPSAAVAGGIDITCGGVPAGTLQPGTPGTPGTPGVQGPPGGVGSVDGCYLQPSTAGGYDAICAGQNMGPIVSGGVGGGCSINPGNLGDPYYIFTCPGGATYQVAKAICGTIAYDPDRYACDYSDPSNPKIDASKCGSAVIDETTQFCQNAATSTVKYFCGPVTDTVRTYSASQFCQPKISATAFADVGRDSTVEKIATINTTDDAAAIKAKILAAVPNAKIENRCGGAAYSEAQFCYNNATVYQKCVNSSTSPVTDPTLIASGGKTYEPGQLCQIDGSVQASCGGTPYTPDIEFCQGGTSIKLLCSRKDVLDSVLAINPSASTTNVKGKEYPATQFCQVLESEGSAMSSSDSRKDGLAKNSTEATNGKIKPFCIVNIANNVRETYPQEYFCQANATTTGSARQLLCGFDTDPGATPPTVALKDGKEYPATKFCQKGNGGSGSGVAVTTTALTGIIKDKCGTGTSLVTYGEDHYCALDRNVATTLSCTGGSASYDPETQFCIESSGSVQYTCKVRTTPGTTTNNNSFTTAAAAISAGFYDPAEKVCETKGNILYGYQLLGQNNWLTENARPNGINSFTWIAAKDACPAGWQLPTDAQWKLLATAATIGSAGVNLRATTGWTTNSTDATYSKFAAVPAAVTGITPAPTGNYAYWWTANEGGYAVNTADKPVLDYNQGNYRSILELSTAVGEGSSPKMTTNLSVRCIRTSGAVSGITPQEECSSSGGTWSTTTCSCPTTHNLVGNACVLKTSAQTACEQTAATTSGATWNSTSSTCECSDPGDNDWNGTICAEKPAKTACEQTAAAASGASWNSTSSTCECSTGDWNGTICE